MAAISGFRRKYSSASPKVARVGSIYITGAHFQIWHCTKTYIVYG